MESNVYTIQGVSDYLLDVAKGRISGHSIMNKFAANPLITTLTDPETVWAGGGLYPFHPITAQTMEIVSAEAADAGALRTSGTATGGSITTLEDDINDFIAAGVQVGDLLVNTVVASSDQYTIITGVSTHELQHLPLTNSSQTEQLSSPNKAGNVYNVVYAASTGVAAVAVYGLDANYIFQSEVVLMAGETEVTLSKQYIRQWRATAVLADSRDGAAGDIQVQVAGGGDIACFLPAKANQTLQAFYTIPANKTGNLIQMYVSLGKGGGATPISALFSWGHIPLGGCRNVKGEIELVNTGPGYWSYRYGGAPIIPPCCDIDVICEEVSATVGVQAGMDILLRKL